MWLRKQFCVTLALIDLLVHYIQVDLHNTTKIFLNDSIQNYIDFANISQCIPYRPWN